MEKNILRKIAGVVLFATVLAIAMNGVSRAEPDPGKIEEIKKLLAVSGIREQLTYMRDSLLNSFAQMIAFSYPEVPEEFWREFNVLIGQEEMDNLVDGIVPVYDKHMSRETVRELIKMFETPFWEEWKSKMPEISREAGLIGSQWGQELSQSETFRKKIDALTQKYDLEKLNAKKNETR